MEKNDTTDDYIEQLLATQKEKKNGWKEDEIIFFMRCIEKGLSARTIVESKAIPNKSGHAITSKATEVKMGREPEWTKLYEKWKKKNKK